MLLAAIGVSANAYVFAQNNGAQLAQRAQVVNPATVAHIVVNATKPQPAPTPRVLGLTCTQAQEPVALRRLKVRVTCVVGTALGQTPGSINRQDPEVDAPLGANRTITAYFEPETPAAASPLPDYIAAALRATKSRRYLVPSLYGESCKGADSIARKAGFPGVKCRAAVSDVDLKAGAVFDQRPPAKTVVAKPMSIEVSIKQELPRAVVPDVVGKTVRQALIALQGARLAGQVDGISSAALAVVQTQVPGAKSVVPQGTSVRLTTVIVVPDLSGLRCEAAKTLALSYGLVVRACQAHEPTSGASPLGRVYAQEPKAGVTLTADVPAIVQVVAHAVPSVEGERLTQAQVELKAKGLIPVPDNASAPDHRLVHTQEPRAGALYETPIRVRLTTIGLSIVPSLQKFNCADAEKLLMAKGLGSDCHADRQWWRVGTPTVYGQIQAAGSELPEGTVIRSQAKAMDMGKVGATLLALLAALGTVGLVLRPSMHLTVRPDLAPEVTIREADKDGGDFAGLSVRGESDPDGLPIIRFTSKGGGS